MSRFFNIYEEYGEKFFRVPKVFFTSDKYKSMSNDAKLAYAILQDRFELSIRNRWYDQEGNIYFKYTNDHLGEILQFGNKKTVKIKKELMDCDLFRQVRVGLNQPNRLYLLKPEITDKDVYQIDRHESDDTPEDNAQKPTLPRKFQNDTSGSVPRTLQEVFEEHTNDTDSSDTYRDTKDTTDTKSNESQHPWSEKERQKQKDAYINQAYYANTYKIPPRIANMLRAFSQSEAQANDYYKLIMTAKSKVEEETETIIWLEHEPELEHEIIQTFSRCIRRIEKDRDITNPNGYIYESLFMMLGKAVVDRDKYHRFHSEPDLPFYIQDQEA